MADLKRYSAKWFTKRFDDGEEDSFKIRYTPDAVFERLTQECTEEVEGEGGRLDIERFNQKLLEHCLLDWRNIRAGKREVPCTPKWIRALRENMPDRAYYVAERARDYTAFSGDYLDIKKNLEDLLNTLSERNGTRPSSQAAASASSTAEKQT